MSHPASDVGAGGEAFFAGVLSGLPEAVIVTAPDGRVLFINRAVTRLLGNPPSEVVGSRSPCSCRARASARSIR